MLHAYQKHSRAFPINQTFPYVYAVISQFIDPAKLLYMTRDIQSLISNSLEVDIYLKYTFFIAQVYTNLFLNSMLGIPLIGLFFIPNSIIEEENKI